MDDGKLSVGTVTFLSMDIKSPPGLLGEIFEKVYTGEIPMELRWLPQRSRSYALLVDGDGSASLRRAS